MKKFLIAAAASLVLFGAQPDVQAAPIEFDTIQTQEVGKWAHFRDKYILNRETENERRDRMEWERRHGYREDRHKYYYDEYYYPRRDHRRDHRHRY